MKWLIVLLSGIALSSLIYAKYEVRRAAMQRVAACQMLPDRKSWDEFECREAFKRAGL